MMKMKALVLAVLVFLVLVSGAEAKRYSNYRWDDKETILVENRMGPEWNDAVQFSVHGWEKAFPRLEFKVVNKPGVRECRGAIDKIVICESDVNNRWSGLTFVSWNRHEIESVVIRVVNYSPLDGYNQPWRGSEVVSLWDMNTLCHELGHALGLNHNQSPKSCLESEVRITPGQFDRQSLKKLYNQGGKGWP